MFRICIAALSAALIIAAAASPAPAAELKNDIQPTACDCSNCSAQHCQGGGPGTPIFLRPLVRNESVKTGPNKAEQTR